MLEGSPLSESSCWQCSGIPKGLYSDINVQRYHSNKRKLLRHAKKWIRASYLHKTERKVVTGCCFVTQYMPSYGTSHHQHHSNTELGKFLSTHPQCIRFPSVWSHQEFSKRSSICGWWPGEKSDEWLHKQPKTFLPEASRSLQIAQLSVTRRKEIILKSNILLMSKT